MQHVFETGFVHSFPISPQTTFVSAPYKSINNKINQQIFSGLFTSLLSLAEKTYRKTAQESK